MVAEEQAQAAAPIKGLAVGRIVHYVLPEGRSEGEHRPAVIVRVWSQHDPGLVNLQVFTDGATAQSSNDGLPPVWWRTSVHHDPDEKQPGTWHFPEYVP